MRYVLMLWVLFFSKGFFAQQKKEFYDEQWKASDSSEASYYRLITYDEAGKPLGVVRDYYITGEKQWDGHFSYIDKLGSDYGLKKDNGLKEGLCTWYYKNGKMSSRGFFVNGKLDGTYKTWFESGARKTEVQYKNGTLHGLYIIWSESGILREFAVYQLGYLVGNTSLLCDEYELGCTRIFSQSFAKPWTASLVGNIKTKKERYSGFKIDWHRHLTHNMYEASDIIWPETKDKHSVSKMTDKGYRITSRSASAFRLIRRPIDYSEDFALIVSFLSGKSKADSKHGLVWNYQNKYNYHYFRLSGQGSYQIGTVHNGHEQILHQGSALHYDRRTDIVNDLCITKKDDTLRFFIGTSPVYQMLVPEFLGNQIGFVVAPDSDVYFTSFSTVEKVDMPFVSPDVNAPSIRKKAWTGNGSGFFISTQGHIVTNYHVIEKAHEIEIDIIRDHKQVSYQCVVLVSDKTNDLAIIQVKDTSFVPFKDIPYTIKTTLSDVGTPVFALGYPLTLSLGTELKFTEGTVNSRTGKEGAISAYQISAPVYPGNSGGPLFDYEGNILGVINEKLFKADNVAFAIKANYIVNLIDLMPFPPDYPQVSKMKDLPATEQVKLLRQFVPLIKVK